MKNKKLHIVYLDFDDLKNPLLGAGQARATFEVGKRLAQKRHKITVICSRYPGYKDRTENGITYHHIGLGSHNIRLNNTAYILALPLSVIKIRADIIVECFTAPISTLFSPLFTRIPVVALPTSFEADRFAKLYHLPFDLVEKFGLRFYKYAMPFSEPFEKKMKQYNSRLVSLIVPEGVGNEYFMIKQQAPKYILFLGRLDIGQKGIDLLLKAYAKIVNKVDYPLIIAGNGPDQNKVKKLISTLHIEDSVTMIGGTFNKKKMRVLSQALFVAFSSRHEGFSLFALEAFASGLPLVCFDIPGLCWTTKDATFKAKPFSILNYAQLLQKATDKKIIIPMRKNARKFAKKYTWENVANSYETFFYSILKERNIHAN